MPHSQPGSGGTRLEGLDYIVLASAKSGTTWMQCLLSAHPNVHCSESRLFGRYFDKDNPSGPNLTVESYVENLTRHYNPPVAASDSPAFYQSLLHNIINAIARTSRDASGKPIYGEKLTPYVGTGLHTAEQLIAYNPNIRLIHLVRDGRDVIVSGAVHRSNLQLRTAHPARADELRHALASRRITDEHFEFFSSLWIDSVNAGLLATSRLPHALTIRYEDMLTAPHHSLERVLAFIGADPAHAGPCLEAASFEKMSGGRRAGQEDRSNFFRRGVAGDWRTWLTDAQIESFDARAGSLLGALGYDRSLTPSATT